MKTLLDQCKAGDEQAIATLVQRYRASALDLATKGIEVIRKMESLTNYQHSECRRLLEEIRRGRVQKEIGSAFLPAASGPRVRRLAMRCSQVLLPRFATLAILVFKSQGASPASPLGYLCFLLFRNSAELPVRAASFSDFAPGSPTRRPSPPAIDHRAIGRAGVSPAAERRQRENE